MLNYFNFAEYDRATYLLTNDFGEYHFLPKAHLETMIRSHSELPDELYAELLEKRFLLPPNVEPVIESLIKEYRGIKTHLLAATSLHIFVLTNECNGACTYCQAQHNNTSEVGKMTMDIARRAVDIALQSPSRYLSFEFQGGEPLMNFEVIRYIVEYAQREKGEHIIEYSLVSNLSLMTDDMMAFFREWHISLSTSLDGPKTLHDANRPLRSDESAYDIVVEKLTRLKEFGLSPGAIETTTRLSLQYPCEIIDEYVNRGFHSIFIRPLTPLGYASSNWDVVGYEAEEYASFYKKALRYLIDLNKRGAVLREGHASIFLAKILQGRAQNYMELRSPCGAAVGQLAYYFDGNIYTCDEARMLGAMGDMMFCLGNVFESSYERLMDSPVCKATCVASTLESTPGCCDCVYQPYCGACPVVTHANSGGLFPTQAREYHCKVFRGMLDSLFELLREDDPQVIEILQSWI